MILQSESYESWYCLPDSRFFHVCNPETSSRVTLATLGTVFQTDFVALLARCLLDITCWISLVGCCFLAILAINQTTKSQNNKTTRIIAYRNLHIGWSFHRSRVRLFMQSEVFP